MSEQENVVRVELRLIVNGKERVYRAVATTPGDPEPLIFGAMNGVQNQATHEKNKTRWWEDSTGGAPTGLVPPGSTVVGARFDSPI